MEKKTHKFKRSFVHSSNNISAQWCKEWGEDLLSEEVLADRIAELIKQAMDSEDFLHTLYQI